PMTDVEPNKATAADRLTITVRRLSLGPPRRSNGVPSRIEIPSAEKKPSLTSHCSTCVALSEPSAAASTRNGNPDNTRGRARATALTPGIAETESAKPLKYTPDANGAS